VAVLTPTELDPPFATVVATTSRNSTIAICDKPVAMGSLLALTYVQSVGATADTLTASDVRTNTYVTLPGAMVTNNLQVGIMLSLLTVSLRVGDEVAVTLPAGVTRNRRILGARAFSNVMLPTSVNSAADGKLSPEATPLPLSVSLTNVASGSLIIGAAGTTLGGGALMWASEFPAPSARTAATQAGSSDKRLGNTWRVTDSAGTKLVGATQATPASPWGLVAVELPARSVTFENGRWYRQKNDVYEATGVVA
jgi:hypothetical protein